ncbi:uncharacterized protein LOC111710850 [Eurytemora carolleeae]|uniref:uncharacterized protein LOC111710850 n=1 Tax=Eurytemora carolleeae TaxID=1294199 RepID=UPI000C783658|nr:uncharacterized protein LOC111710850 [Eurytemora carolleeae]|eukprot:XP_023340789.1 uncharacterized protein LOC111710850 [Eurytemora affinis]
MRSHIITDSFVVKLFESCNLEGLEKLLLLVPGVNSIPGILRLTERTVEYVLNNCKGLKKLGNLLTWSLGNHNMNICELVEPVRVPELMIKIKERNWDLNIINKKMTMR